MGTELSRIKAVVFDVYGTLAEIRDRRAPFRQLLKKAKDQGCLPRNAAKMLMTCPGSIREHAERMGIQLSESMKRHLDMELAAELASVRLYDDVNATLSRLH